MKMNKKGQTLLAIILVAIVIVIVAVVVLVKPGSKKNNGLEKDVTNLGKDFYETFYYPSLTSKELLANFTDTGINTNLTTINMLKPITKDTEKKLKDSKCDYDKTKVIIYPKGQFNKSDYTIKVELACEK